MKFIFKLILTFTFIQKSHSVIKCNKRLMNSFLLNGMDYSINQKMRVCGNVRDKCCTLSDEIKISKLWNDRIAPMLATQCDEFMDYIDRISVSYLDLLKLDPRMIVVKYVDYLKISIESSVCSAQEQTCKDNNTEIDFFQNEPQRRIKKFFKENINQKSDNNPGKRKKKMQLTQSNRKFQKQEEEHDLPRDPHILQNELRKSKGPFDFNSFEVNKLEYLNITCPVEQNYFMKDFLIINEIKANFCFNLYQKFLNFDHQQFRSIFPIIKTTLTNIHNIKSAFYCSLCDAHQQKFMNVQTKKFEIDLGYCKTILQTKKEYFEFVHIILIEYFDLIFQYINCFESGGKVFNFPSLNFLTKYKRRIPYIKKCLASFEDKSLFEKNCWIICDKINLLNSSQFFDGDVKLVKRIFFAIYSFFRKFRESGYQQKDAKKTDILNVDGMLVEPLNPGHLITKRFYGNKKLREEILGSTDLRINMVHPEDVESANETLSEIGAGNISQVKKMIKDHKISKEKIKQLQKGIYEGQKLLSEEQKKRIKKQIPTPGYNKISKMKDQLYRPAYEEIHDGYFPQRQLAQINLMPKTATELQIEKLNRLNKFKKPQQKRIKQQKKEPVMNEQVETTSEIFLKNQPPLDVKDFQIEFLNDDGMMPLIHFDLINYRYNIKEIIKHEFKPYEKLNREIVNEYLKLGAKEINKFNKDIDEHVNEYNEMADLIRITELNQKLKQARKYKDTEAVARFKARIQREKIRASQKLKDKENVHKLKKIREIEKNARIKQANDALHTKTEDHIEREHFESNFNGISDFFVHLFGS